MPPAQVLATAWQELFNPTFYQGVALSLWRDLSGFALGSTAGVLLGVLLGVSPLARWMIGPTFHSLRQVSLFAWLPLLAAVAGSGDLSKIVFVAFSAFYPMVLATLEGVQGVSTAHAEVARVYGFSGPQRLFRLARRVQRSGTDQCVALQSRRRWQRAYASSADGRAGQGRAAAEHGRSRLPGHSR